MKFNDIIELVVPKNGKKAKEEDVLKAFVTAFTKDQTLLLDAIHYIYMNRAEGVVKVKLLEDLFAHPRFCWSILHSLIDSDNIPNVKLQVSDEKDVKAEIKRIKLLEHFLLYDSFKINIQTTVPGDQEGNTILHLLAKKERSHSAILSLLLSHLRDIVNSANIGGFTPYLVSVYYKQLWAISCFNLTTSEVNKEAKNAQGQSAEDLAGNDEKVKHAISQIKLEPIGLLPANRKQNSDAFHEKYPTLFLSSRRESAVCSSASYDSISNSLSVSLSFSSSSFSSSFTSSPLCSNRSSELEDPLSPRGSTPSQSFSGGKAESPAQIQLTPRWQMSKSIVYREFERMLENDKQSISKSLQALFTESNLKDKGELLGDLFTLFDAHHCAVQYFEELNQYAQKKYEELLTVNNDLTSQLMYLLITPLKADAAITNLKIDRTKIKTDHPARELSPAASGLIRKKLSKDANNALTAKELDSKLHLREALFILTSKGHLSKNWQVEFDTILSSIIGLQVLYSLEEILTVLNELYNKFDSRQILAGNLLIFQLMLYNANEFFTQSHLIEKANQFIHRGFEEGSEPGFVRKRVRSILQQLITVNQKFYSESFISNYDLLNQWFLKRRPNISFECLIDQGIKQKEKLLQASIGFSKKEKTLKAQCNATAQLIAYELRLRIISFYQAVSLQQLYKYELPKEGQAPRSDLLSEGIGQFNLLMRFFISKLFENPEKLVPALELLASVGKELCPLAGEQYPDLEHLMVLASVFSHLTIDRLKRHFKALSPESSNILKEISKLTDGTHGIKERADIASQYKTTLFFLGRMMTELTNTKESLPRSDGSKLLAHCESSGRVLFPILKLKALIRFFPQISHTDFRQSILENSFDIDEEELYALSLKLQRLPKDNLLVETIEATGELHSFLDQMNERLKFSYIPVIISGGKRIEVYDIGSFLLTWFDCKLTEVEKKLEGNQAGLMKQTLEAKKLYAQLGKTLDRVWQITRLYYTERYPANPKTIVRHYIPVNQLVKAKKRFDNFISQANERLNPVAKSSASSLNLSTVLNKSDSVDNSRTADSTGEKNGNESQRRTKRHSGFFNIIKGAPKVLAADLNNSGFGFEQS